MYCLVGLRNQDEDINVDIDFVLTHALQCYLRERVTIQNTALLLCGIVASS